MTPPRRGTSWANKPVDAGGALRYSAICSPAYQAGVSGWTANQDGTSQFTQLTLIVQASGAAVLIYVGAAGAGNLVGSWSPVAGTDTFGNSYPVGLYTQGGLLQGVEIDNPSVIGGVIDGALLNAPSVVNAAMLAGTITETSISFDSTGGQLLVYTSSTTVVTSFPSGTWQPPAGVTTAKVEMWGAGAGGGGGNTSTGGEGGGGGEYAAEASLSVDPALVYTVDIGGGGSGGSTGVGGTDGGDSTFGSLVVAHGGTAGSGGNPGFAGTGSSNTVHFNGGNGGFGNLGVAGAGGGGSGGSAGAGGDGGSSGASAGAGGTAGSGGGAAGGAGGATGANGVSGSAPGGGGGGAGKGTSVTTVTETFYPSDSWSYYSNSGLRDHNGTMYHGAYSGEAPSYQYSYIQWAQGSLGSDLNTALNSSVISVTLRLTNLHSWYNSGMSFGLHSSTVLGGAQGTYSTILNPGGTRITEGATTTYTLNSSQWAPFKAAGVTYLVLSPDSADLTNLNWYGYFYGAGGAQSSMPRLVVQYQSSGAGSFNAGDGAAGSAKITYTSSSALGAAVSPVSGTDLASNAFAAGFTGQITAFQPSSSPRLTETWHAVSPSITGWTFSTCRYKFFPDNTVHVQIAASLAAGYTSGTVTFFTLPSGYLPSVNFKGCKGGVFDTTSSWTASQINDRFQVTTGGVVQVLGMPVSATLSEYDGYWIIPLD